MPTLREKMKQDMTLIGLADSTQAIYLKAAEGLHNYYQLNPKQLDGQQLRAYLLYLLQNKKLAPNTYNTQVYGLRFFYCTTLRQPMRKLDLPTTKVTYKLPAILSANEVQRIIKSTGNIKHRTLLMVIYGCGLRASEAVNLKIQDIDSKRMTLHIRNAKGGKDRYVILSPVVYKALREYWKVNQFSSYLFTRKNQQQIPMTTAAVTQIFKKAKQAACVTKPGGVHSLRHAYATHLLEAGTDIFSIKSLLGHASIQSTVRYLDFVPNLHKNIQSPIDQLQL